MIHRKVVFAPEARQDLLDIYRRIAAVAGPQTALGYIERLEHFCMKFDIASERGHRRDDIRPGLRIAGFEYRVTVAFTVEEETVSILRIFYGGQNWEEKF